MIFTFTQKVPLAYEWDFRPSNSTFTEQIFTDFTITQTEIGRRKSLKFNSNYFILFTFQSLNYIPSICCLLLIFGFGSLFRLWLLKIDDRLLDFSQNWKILSKIKIMNTTFRKFTLLYFIILCHWNVRFVVTWITFTRALWKKIQFNTITQ